MGTPHADRLYKMESWRTSALEDSHRHLASVSQSLTQIATGNREVAADLGLECATARAACASLDRLAGVPRCKPRTTRRRPPPRSRRRARRVRPPAWSGICLLCTTRWHRPRRSREEREWPATRHTKPHARPARCKRPPRAPLSSVRREPHLRPLRPCRHGGSFAARPRLCARQRLRAARPLRCGAVPPGSPAPPRQLLVALLGSFVERPQLCAPRQPRQPLAARPGLFAARLPPCAPRRPRQLRPGSPAGEPRPEAPGPAS